MFIRKVETKNKKTGKIYIKHRLVESYTTDSGSRQRTVMELGKLDLPKSEWKKLAHALESILSGQQTLLSAFDSEIENLALRLVSNKRLSEQIESGASRQDEERELATVDLNTVTTLNTRSLGAEIVCQWA